MRARRIGAVAASLLLMLAFTPATASNGTSPGPLTLTVSGHRPWTPNGPFGLLCDGQERRASFEPGGSLDVWAGGTTCHVGDIGRDDGNLACWESQAFDPPAVAIPFDGTAAMEILHGRADSGEEWQ